MVNLREYILEKAKELNIDIIGFTSGDPLINMRDYLKDRLARNLQTEFEEKDLEKRINPKLSLSNCRSIIVIGISYNLDYKLRDDISPRGSLSKSSWGIDYHRVLKEKLESLIEEIRKIEEFNYKYFVDTGPLLDRELANRAGIGFYGKNCSIINKDYGSYIFLGHILTDLYLEESSPSTEDCGSCDLCIRACPTKALEAPYRLNPKRCISYLTQTKDHIPEDLRANMTDKIYGCDTCQVVCPKNKGAKKSSHREFMPHETGGIIDIRELLSMSNREFKLKYGSMAGSWRGKSILVRNSIIALGNTKRIEHLPLLYELIEKENKWEEYISWAINNIKNNQ